jgi:hypothetical protein
VHVMRLSDAGATPEERRAIKREIDRAVGDSALNVAENIVEAIKDRSQDPVRKQEMERALSPKARSISRLMARRSSGVAPASDRRIKCTGVENTTSSRKVEMPSKTMAHQGVR